MRTLLGLALTLGFVVMACGRAAEPPEVFGSGGFPGGTGGSYGPGGSYGGPCGSYPRAIPVTGVTPMPGCMAVFSQGVYTGYFYSISDKLDGGGSVICPECNELGCSPLSTSMCATGTAGKVIGTAYSTYWGVGLVWNLNQPVSAPTCRALDAPGSVDLAGKIITASFDAPPAAFRIQLDTGSPTDYLCADVSGKSTISIPAADFVDQCWTSGMRIPITAAQLASVKALRFMIPTNTSADVPFDFCITSLSIQ